MGGQNAAIVFDDADPARTAAMVAGAAMGYAGQKCTATRRVIVVGSDSGFVEAFVTAVRRLAAGRARGADTTVGPVISEGARDRGVGRRRGWPLSRRRGSWPAGGPRARRLVRAADTDRWA